MQTSIGYLQQELETKPMGQESTQMIKDGMEVMKKKLATTLEEIALIFCPIPNCPTHTNQTKQSDGVVTESGAKSTENEKKNNPKLGNDKNNAK
ncbi:uncharacterized protein TNCV_2071961 [Trichonephila clavipes]|nr:uncharacterized protein TNCV_2071961 [Trichonephila clavipes]